MHHNEGENKGCGMAGCDGIFWWMKLLVAVLAVPSFAIIVATVIPIQGVGQVIVFVLSCWLCTWLGMKLMQNSKIK